MPNFKTNHQFRDSPSAFEIIRSPLFEKYKTEKTRYARNVWCMEVFNDRLYFGHGCANNESFSWYASNSGPCKIAYYDLTTGEFGYESDDLPVEEFYRFQNIDGVLYAPCADHIGGDTEEYLFRREVDGTWTRLIIPFKSLHSYSVVKYDNKLWIDLAMNETSRAAAAYSSDGGATWNLVKCYNTNGTTLINSGYAGRITSFCVFNDELYAIGLFSGEWFTAQKFIFKYNPVSNRFVRTESSEYVVPNSFHYPEFPSSEIMGTSCGAFSLMPKGFKTLLYNNTMLLILGEQVFYGGYYDDHHNSAPLLNLYTFNRTTKTLDTVPFFYPGNFYTAPSGSGGKFPFDMKIYDGRLYVLVDSIDNFIGVDDGSGMSRVYERNCIFDHRIEIWSTEDLINWVCNFSNKCTTFGRSFAIHNGHAYIGLGGGTVNNSIRAGEIWKIKLNG